MLTVGLNICLTERVTNTVLHLMQHMLLCQMLQFQYFLWGTHLVMLPVYYTPSYHYNHYQITAIHWSLLSSLRRFRFSWLAFPAAR